MYLFLGAPGYGQKPPMEAAVQRPTDPLGFCIDRGARCEVGCFFLCAVCISGSHKVLVIKGF